MPSKSGIHPAYRESMTPAKSQKRYSKLSDAADSDKKPFASDSSSMKINKENKAESKKREGAESWENSYSMSRAMRADRRNVAEAKTNKELGKTYLKSDKYSPEGEKK